MKTRYIFSSAILALTAISCTDLDVDIKSQYTELPDSEIATEAQLSNAFYGFRGALGRRFDEGVSCNSDEYTAVSFDGDYLNGRDMANFSLHMIDPDASKNQPIYKITIQTTEGTALSYSILNKMDNGNYEITLENDSNRYYLSEDSFNSFAEAINKIL